MDLTYSLYEWTATGGVQLVSVLPNGEAAPATSGTSFGPGGGTGIGGGIESCQVTRTVLRHAISADGSRAFWTYVPESPSEPHQLYARLNGSETIQLDKAANPKNSGNGVFRAASADGSVVYFTAENTLVSGANPEKGKPDLYRYQFGVPKAQTLTDLTKGAVPGDVKGVVGASDDGSYVYFVAGAVLSADPNKAGQVAEAGKNNLYLHHEGADQLHRHRWRRRITATGRPTRGIMRARVSPDGRHLAFLSIEAEKLAGYDNTIAAGEHCQYDTTDGRETRTDRQPALPTGLHLCGRERRAQLRLLQPLRRKAAGPDRGPGLDQRLRRPALCLRRRPAALLRVLRRAAAGR